MEKVFESGMQRLIINEMQPILREHKELQESIVSVVRSQAATPVPQAQDIARTKEQIAELLKRNKINDAFQVVSDSFYCFQFCVGCYLSLRLFRVPFCPRAVEKFFLYAVTVGSLPFCRIVEEAGLFLNAPF